MIFPVRANCLQVLYRKVFAKSIRAIGPLYCLSNHYHAQAAVPGEAGPSVQGFARCRLCSRKHQQEAVEGIHISNRDQYPSAGNQAVTAVSIFPNESMRGRLISLPLRSSNSISGDLSASVRFPASSILDSSPSASSLIKSMWSHPAGIHAFVKGGHQNSFKQSAGRAVTEAVCFRVLVKREAGWFDFVR